MKKIFNIKTKDMNAITLIALVITIVVLIILATVIINLSLGENGLFNRAREAKEEYQNAQDYENTEIARVSNEIDNYVGGNREITDEDINNKINQALSNYTIVRRKDYSFTTSSSNTYIHGSYAVDAIDGYEPIGVVGIYSPILDWIPYTYRINSGLFEISFRNYRSATVTFSISADILYRKVLQ